MESSGDLLQNVYAYFLNAYRHGAPDAARSDVVAFETIGFSPGCSALTGNNIPAAALEEVSRFTDDLPQIVEGIYTRVGRTISITYGTIMDAAAPSSAASITTFADLKSMAQKAYQGTLGSFDGPMQFLPTYPTPIDWYDLSNTSNWQSYSHSASTQTPVTATAAPSLPMKWHIVPPPMRAQILARSSSPVAPPATVTKVETTTSIDPIRIFPAAPPTTVVPPPAATTLQASPTHGALHLIRLSGLAAVNNIVKQIQQQPVDTQMFTVSFDYCLVRLSRPWLSGDLLATPGWYVPGMRGGDYASGTPDDSSPFAAIPTAFIAIKNLVIEAAWSNNDLTARANSASLGPFSLLGGGQTDDKSAVRNPGIQIIAWICRAQPKLPPDPDPSLAVATATPPQTVPATPTNVSADDK